MKLYTSLLTPFDAHGRVDHARLRAHILWQMARGIDGFVAGSIHAEAPYLSIGEREAILQTVMDTVLTQPVVAQVWDPSAEATARLGEAASAMGVHALLLPPPLHYTSDDETLLRIYRDFSQRTQTPVYAEHRVHGAFQPVSEETYAQLVQEGSLQGVLDGSQDPFRLQRLVDVGPVPCVLAQGDPLLMDSAPEGLQAVVSVLANGWPQLCHRVARGEPGLHPALLDRIACTRHVGPVRTLKTLLRMGHRPPVLPCPDSLLAGIPDVEQL